MCMQQNVRPILATLVLNNLVTYVCMRRPRLRRVKEEGTYLPYLTPHDTAIADTAYFPSDHPLFLLPFLEGVRFGVLVKPESLSRRLLLPYISSRKYKTAYPLNKGIRPNYQALPMPPGPDPLPPPNSPREYPLRSMWPATYPERPCSH
jgi:hypothetical protein